jgi:hypothetical protein
MAYHSGCDYSSLKPAGMPHMKGLGLPATNHFFTFPITLDLEPVIVEAAASIALPVNTILKGPQVQFVLHLLIPGGFYFARAGSAM